jgi:voltage-gated potassium channel
MTHKYDRWVERTDGPLLALALPFLAAFVLPLYVPDLPAPVRTALLVVNVVVWLSFALDYGVRLALSDDRRGFVRGHVPDLLAVMVPVLRPLRLLRLVGVLGTASRRASQRTQLRTTSYLVAAILVLLVVSGGLILDAERDAPGANITGAGDALWWAATTVTTVGYGDRFPVTATGRGIAVLLMLGGIALLGVITASVAAWFVRHFSALEAQEAAVDRDVLAALDAISRRLEGMQVQLDAALQGGREV